MLETGGRCIQVRNSRSSRKHEGSEALLHTSFSKLAGKYFFRIASGVEGTALDVLSPMLEMILTKMAEMFAESIPAAIIQGYAFLNRTDVSAV